MRCFLLFLIFPLYLFAKQLDITNTWSGTNLNGWYGNKISNTNEYLNIKFDTQDLPVFEETIIQKNLTGIVITNISFNLMSFNTLPSNIKLYIHSSFYNRIWSVNINPVQTNSWINQNIIILYSGSWIALPINNREVFNYDVNWVDWIGLQVVRSGDTIEQNYGIDDFNITGFTYIDNDQDGMADVWETAYGFDTNDASDASLDYDADQMSNLAEFRAGTDPIKYEDRLVMYITNTNNLIIIYWPSVLNRYYTLEQSTDMFSIFSVLQSNIMASPPLNTFKDYGATNSTRFYKLLLEQQKDHPE